MTVSAFEGIDKKAKPERSLLENLKKNLREHLLDNGQSGLVHDELIGVENIVNIDQHGHPDPRFQVH